MATRLQIYNNSLILARIKPMESETDRSSAAAYLAQLEFPSQLLMLLREVPWNFAKRTATLQQVEGRDRGIYWKPTDPPYVRLWWEDDPRTPAADPMLIEDGPFLCTTGTGVPLVQTCEYIGLVPLEDMPVHFTNVLGLRLAKKISVSHSPIQVQQSIKMELREEEEKSYAIERAGRARPRPNYADVGREYARYGESLYGPSSYGLGYDGRRSIGF